MIREEKIKRLKALKARCERLIVSSDRGPEEWRKDAEALDLALSALRPVSREQVEKVWFGCDICRGDKEVKSDNFCGAATMRIVGDSIDLRGDEKKIKFFGHIYAPSFSVRFCPFCGKPLTDEAVQMVMERLEALKDGSTTD